MSEAEVRAYLESQQILNVATIGPTGHPHIVAMWYAFVDDELAFWTFAKSQKILNLRRDPKMSGLVESGGGSYNELRGVELVGDRTNRRRLRARARDRQGRRPAVQRRRCAQRRGTAVHRGPGTQAAGCRLRGRRRWSAGTTPSSVAGTDRQR